MEGLREEVEEIVKATGAVVRMKEIWINGEKEERERVW